MGRTLRAKTLRWKELNVLKEQVKEIEEAEVWDITLNRSARTKDI